MLRRCVMTVWVEMQSASAICLLVIPLDDADDDLAFAGAQRFLALFTGCIADRLR